jgi:hypothetical protein
MSQTLPVIPSQLANGFCPVDYQDLLNTFSSHQSVVLPDFSGVVASSSKPTDQTLTWLQLDQFGRPIRLYKFAQGAWLSLHPLVPGLTQWWFDVLPSFATFDGGDADPISVLSGPMWQQAKNSDGVTIAARFPVAAGTLPSTTVLAQGDTGGEEKHVLTPAEGGFYLPVSAATLDDGDADTGAFKSMLNFQLDGHTVGAVDAAGTPNAPFTLGSATPSGHNTMPPYVVGYLLQRSGRLFYAVT